MIEILTKIREQDKTLVFSKKVINTFIVLVFGIVLGIFSKWLDNTPLNDSIMWKRFLLGYLDLGNVFSMIGIWLLIALCISIYSATPLRASINVFIFFLGMNISYHIYTIIFAGFNPMNYMMIWYFLTLFSPILAFICWYSKGAGIIPVIINTCIIAIMILCCFGIGMWYFDFTSIINTIIFIITLIILYNTPQKSIITLIGGLVIAFVVTLL
ncbi:hypothetical protein [Intestinibacter bartlettii]|mgnify:FL=1|uniref:TspO/MBR family protein n=1 Tax=Intestinibacter bartlettii TaxID=261299 RepID=A0ABS8CTB9_9FIRM|nr:hypothetical protein [Intestinibacter bartlettii]MCB5395891.1 hypothetical protein [Intestinibacter bartlettii]MCB5402440.1 hypothetical protein [Intestinibacter bartlettii]MCB5444696.1 hypothetical protein [Intestinibacter bartlettii]MCB5719754.1 hypothetical protein [Intestinibacter bartlettii]MCB5747690.1 hypothetical protein [Intestinibacter bartlettii]